MPKLSREKRFNNRIKELKAIYAPLPEEKMSLALPLIENMVFIEFQMSDLQQVIQKEGFVDKYQNGNNQFGTKQSANLQSYNALVKSYNIINTRLENMLPKVTKKSKLEKMLNG